MKLLGRRDNGADDAEDAPDAEAETTAPQDPPGRARTTAPKGRPTPKRSDRSKPRGPVAPAPMTTAEARRRRKELRKTMTKEERKAAKLKRRAALAERQERMKSGEEAYLLARDQGPVRRYVRDIVDARPNLLGLLMPATLVLLFAMIALPKVAYYLTFGMPLLMIATVIDAILLSRKVNRAVEAKYPDSGESHFKLGLYAVSRATQIRRTRIPRPQVSRGAKVV